MNRNGLQLLALGSIIAFIAQFRLIDDFDIGWQIKLGELALDRWQLIRTDPFSYTHFGQPVPAVGWLAQIAFALVHQHGGWYALRIVAGLLFAGAFVLAGWTACLQKETQHRQPNMFSLATAVTMGFLAALSNSSVRPQLIGLLCFAGLLHWAPGPRPLWHKLLIVVPLLVLWQNSHPSVLVGVVALVPVLSVRWLESIRARQRDRSGLPWDLTLLVVLVGLSQWATPEGWRITEISGRNLEVARDLLRSTEWLPAWSAEVRGAIAVFWGELVLTLLLLCRLRFRWRWSDGLTFLALTALALYAARFVLFWSVAMVPLWARWIEQARPAALFAFDGQVAVRRSRFLWTAVLGSLLLLLIPPAMLAVTGQSQVSDEIPSAAVARLKSVVAAGRIYNYREYGGPLILAGAPAWQVHIDGRLYLYDQQDWAEYHRAAAGQIPLEKLIGAHRPAAFFLRPSFDRELIEQLRQSLLWREDYRDTAAVIFLPAGPGS